MDIPAGWTKSDRFDDFYEYKNGQMFACIRHEDDVYKVDFMRYEVQEGYDVCYKVDNIGVFNDKANACRFLFSEMNRITYSEPY